MSFMTKIKIFFFLKVILLCVVSSFCHRRWVWLWCAGECQNSLINHFAEISWHTFLYKDELCVDGTWPEALAVRLARLRGINTNNARHKFFVCLFYEECSLIQTFMMFPFDQMKRLKHSSLLNSVHLKLSFQIIKYFEVQVELLCLAFLFLSGK